MQIEYSLFLVLISSGFFNGFLHCSTMCGPFVLAQTSSNLSSIKIENFNNFQKLKSIALLPYHFGRITTYAFLGFLSSLLAQNVRDFANFKKLSAILLFIAAILFLNAFLGKKAKIFPAKLKIKLPKFINLGALFANPRGIRGYFLGIILGFIPCSLLYSSFLVVANFQNPFLAASAMIFFGFSTIPALFFVSFSGLIFNKIDADIFKKFAKFVMLINSLILFFMAIWLW